MILDYDFYGEDDSLDTCDYVRNINLLEFENMRMDKLYMTTDIVKPSGCELPNWENNTVLSAEFRGNAEAGSIGANGFEITTIAVKRRKKNELQWNLVDEIPYVSSEDGYLVYEGEDKFVEAYETYEYAITPKSGDVEGNYNVSEINVDFEWAYIFDKEHYYRLIYDFTLGNIIKQMPNSTITTLGSKYPIVVYNGNVNYSEGSVECKILFVEDGDYDKRRTKELRENVVSFLMNRKPKVLKGADGLYLIIDIIGSPTLSFNEGANNVYDLSFDFVEIADSENYEELLELDLIGVDTIDSA